MNHSLRSRGRGRGIFRSAATTTNACARFRKHIALFGLAVTISAVLLAPPAIHAQRCAGNIHDGCTNEGAVCRPVTSGFGQSGRCTTSGSNHPHAPRECNCLGAPEPAVDPRCSNRSGTGKFDCIINQPVVTQHETEYPAIAFAPGDVVDVKADGCVQTGGTGKTWKRYVNPTGANSDRLYHGLIRIPTGTKDSALVRINTVMERHLLVTGTGVPLSQLVLHLGYEDDDYSDNGYYSHDDGTEDQCKTSGTNNGEPAFVMLTIYRGVSPDAPESRFDFDVLSNSLDPNGFPFNPQWSWQTRPENQGKVPDTSLCHQFSKHDWPLPGLSPNFPDCTDQADLSTVDLPGGVDAVVCDYGGLFISDSFSGHVNWFPVTVEGSAGWGDQSTDLDYTFTFTSPDVLGNPLYVNSRLNLHAEFDARETIDHFSTQEWGEFRQAVMDNNKDLAAKLFDGDPQMGGHVILTGMFGLDGEHNLKSELHPLYALAIRRNQIENDPGDEGWLMFVRNRGDEGFCSSSLWDSGFEDYTFRLPWRPGMTSVEVNWDKTQFDGTDGTSGPTVAMLPPPAPSPGVFVTFHLGPAASSPFIDGVLHLTWMTQPVATPRRPIIADGIRRPAISAPPPAVIVGGEGGSNEADEVEHGIAAAMNQLTPAQRQQVEQASVIAVTPPAVHRLPPTGPVQRITAPPARVRIGRLHAIKAGPAVQKLARDAAQIHALCAVTHNAPAGLPASVCTSNVRDHR